MLYQTLWRLALPEHATLAKLHALRAACRHAARQHKLLGMALLFNGSSVWLLAEGDAAHNAAVGLLLEDLALPAEQGPFAQPVARGAPPTVAPGECVVGYLAWDDAEEYAAPGPALDQAPWHLALFQRRWQLADRG